MFTKKASQTEKNTETKKKKSKTTLSSAEKKQIREIIAKHKPVGKKEKSAQESVPFLRV